MTAGEEAAGGSGLPASRKRAPPSRRPQPEEESEGESEEEEDEEAKQAKARKGKKKVRSARGWKKSCQVTTVIQPALQS